MCSDQRKFTFASLAFLLILPLQLSLAQDSDWPVYGGDFGATKYSPLKQISSDNVKRLKPAWVYRCDDMQERPASTIECNPLVIDGRMYLTTPGLKVVAL